MSRSYLRDKWIRKKTYGRPYVWVRKHNEPQNEHCLDEMPKNCPSKFIVQHIGFSTVQWLQEPGSFGGHKPHKGGHARVSGIVRAKVRAEYRRLIKSELNQ